MLGLLFKALQGIARLFRNKAVRDAAVKGAAKAKLTFKDVSRKSVQSCKLWARNRKIRQTYNARKRELAKDIKSMRAEGKSSEEIAKRAHEFRKAERLKARDEMVKNGDGDLVKKLQQRDLQKYKNPDGPDFKQITERNAQDLKKKLGRDPTPDEVNNSITESATKTDIWTNVKFLAF